MLLNPPRHGDSALESSVRFDVENSARVDDAVPQRDVARREELEHVEVDKALVLLLGGR